MMKMMVNKVAEPQYEEARTTVFWDTHNMPIPEGAVAAMVLKNIRTGLGNLNYRGPLSVYAYSCFSDPYYRELSSLALFALTLLPESAYDNFLDSTLLDDVIVWMDYCPAPANIMLILRDCDSCLAKLLKSFPERGYNVLLAYVDPLDEWSLLAYADITTRFRWLNLANGVYEEEPHVVASLVVKKEATLEDMVALGLLKFDDEENVLDQATLEDLVVATDQVTLEELDGNGDKRRGSRRDETEERKRARTADDDEDGNGDKRRGSGSEETEERKRAGTERLTGARRARFTSPERASVTRHDEDGYGDKRRGSWSEETEERKRATADDDARLTRARRARFTSPERASATRHAEDEEVLEDVEVATDEATLEDLVGNGDKRRGSGSEETEERKRAGTERLTGARCARFTSPERASVTRHDEFLLCPSACPLALNSPILLFNHVRAFFNINEEDYSTAEEALKTKKEEPSFELSGKLAEETNSYQGDVSIWAFQIFNW
ncbi:hypothetical protein DY000_02064415 [Brassica cretica]|uniref:NYN domain-containing protein n=1 Tax=Brassica cretica TaxID=69181 RepID=A0ABQ7BSA8_BRACR|nr:hypothetical protein DY000_02064415 [Brassica cretica]